MIEPITVNLSRDIINTLPIKEIIYAEYAPPGAMGNEGGLMLYVIKDDKLICYEAYIYEDENLYIDMVTLLVNNQISSSYDNPGEEV